eukprot:scaffold1181_cov152-Amphora_coffeaeformis.AAC.7
MMNNQCIKRSIVTRLLAWLQLDVWNCRVANGYHWYLVCVDLLCLVECGPWTKDPLLGAEIRISLRTDGFGGGKDDLRLRQGGGGLLIFVRLTASMRSRKRRLFVRPKLSHDFPFTTSAEAFSCSPHLKNDLTPLQYSVVLFYPSSLKGIV